MRTLVATHSLSPALLMCVHAGGPPCTFFILWYPEFFVCWLVGFLLLEFFFWFCLYFFYQCTSLRTQIWKSKGVTSSQFSGTLAVVGNMTLTLEEAFPWTAPMFESLLFCSEINWYFVLFLFDIHLYKESRTPLKNLFQEFLFKYMS